MDKNFEKPVIDENNKEFKFVEPKFELVLSGDKTTLKVLNYEQLIDVEAISSYYELELLYILSKSNNKKSNDNPKQIKYSNLVRELEQAVSVFNYVRMMHSFVMFFKNLKKSNFKHTKNYQNNIGNYPNIDCDDLINEIFSNEGKKEFDFNKNFYDEFKLFIINEYYSKFSVDNDIFQLNIADRNRIGKNTQMIFEKIYKDFDIIYEESENFLKNKIEEIKKEI